MATVYSTRRRPVGLPTGRPSWDGERWVWSFMSASTRRTWLLFCGLLLLLAGLVMARLYTGDLPGWDKFRIPRGLIAQIHLMLILKGIIVGAALAISGVALQALLRNVLAEPFILGLSTGAAAGLMVQLLIESRLEMSFWSWGGQTGQWGAILGSAVTMTVVMMAGRRQGVLEPLTLILVGVVVSMINGAAIMVIRFLLPLERREDISFWLMGRLEESTNFGHVAVVGGVVLVSGLLLWRMSRSLDASSFSDLEALSLGVELGRLRVMLFLIATLTAGAAVSLAGPLGFVGLVCPHLARLIFGPTHRVMIPAAVMLGAGLVVGADLLVRLVHFGQGIMPLGIFTVALGAPFFIWMLRRTVWQGI